MGSTILTKNGQKWRDLPKRWRLIVRTTDQKGLLFEKFFKTRFGLALYLLVTSFDELANVEIYWTRKMKRFPSDKKNTSVQPPSGE